MKGGANGKVLYVPRAIADVIPPNAHFEAELTDEGVLFRFIGFGKPEKPAATAPAWARNGASGDA